MLRKILAPTFCILCLSICPAVAADDGLVAHYNFHEGSGAILHDKTPNRNHAMIFGANWVKTIRGRALKFDGKNNYVNCGRRPALNLKDAVTLEAWVHPEAVPDGEPRLLGKEMNSYSMTYYKDADVWFYINGHNHCAGDMPPGSWYHVAGTFNGTVLRLYIDGRLVRESQAKERTINQAKESFLIGGKPGSPTMFKGMISEVRVYGRALSRDEVWQRYKQTSRTGQVEIRPYILPSGQEVAIELDFRGLGELPKGAVAEVSLVKAGNAILATRKLDTLRSWGRAEAVMDVPDLAPGEYEIWVQISDAAGALVGNKSIEKLKCPARTVEPQVRVGKRLNNLVIELLNLENLPSRREARYSFTNPRNGWVFISTTAKLDEAAKLSVTLDLGGKEQALIVHDKPGNQPQEAMRFLPAGEHRFNVRCDGNASVERLIVRAIPEIVFCKFGSQPFCPQYGPYDWEFLEKHVLRHVNCIVGGRYHQKEKYLPFIKQWRGQGKKWIVEWPAVPYWKNWPEDRTYRFWCENEGFTSPLLDGVIVDEFGGLPPKRDVATTEAIRRLRRNDAFKNKQFIPYVGSFHEPFIRAVVESGYPFAWELYLSEPLTRAATIRSMEVEWARYKIAEWQEKLPGFRERLILCLGYLSGPPETLNTDPSVNYLVWMDMQFNALANDPALRDVYGVMEYTSHYADEEVVRWAGRLYRHYCIEGNRTVLSEDPYLLSHIQNPDFEEGTRGWIISAAGQGSIAVKHACDLAYLQGRGLARKRGDSFLWTTRSRKRPNTFSQEIRDLQPGRLYSLKIFTSDYRDFTEDKPAQEGHHAVSIVLANVDLLPEKCFQHGYYNIHKRFGPDAPKHKVWFNFHRRVFRAKAKSAELTVSDWASEKNPGGPIGQELMFNFIEIQPYFLSD